MAALLGRKTGKVLFLVQDKTVTAGIVEMVLILLVCLFLLE